MRTTSSDLKTLRIKVSGTKHEGRPALLRTLRTGSQVSLVKRDKNPYDENAVAVMYRKRQLGWIPKSANLAVLGLKVEKATIAEVGTDEAGHWSHLVIELMYEPTSPVGKLVHEHGAVVASVLKQMNVPDLKIARWIAGLPAGDQKDSIEEWNQMQVAMPADLETKEPEHEDPRPDGHGRRRRSST